MRLSKTASEVTRNKLGNQPKPFSLKREVQTLLPRQTWYRILVSQTISCQFKLWPLSKIFLYNNKTSKIMLNYIILKEISARNCTMFNCPCTKWCMFYDAIYKDNLIIIIHHLKKILKCIIFQLFNSQKLQTSS